MQRTAWDMQERFKKQVMCSQTRRQLMRGEGGLSRFREVAVANRGSMM